MLFFSFGLTQLEYKPVLVPVLYVLKSTGTCDHYSQLSKKETSQAMKIKITKESSQVKKENSQSLKIIKIKGTNKHPTHNKCPSLNSI